MLDAASKRKLSQIYLRLRPVTVQSARCLRAGGRYWAQAETALCFPAQLWSGVDYTQEH